jgi:chromosome segregation ATPase
MTQTTLADFAGMLSEVRDRVKRIEGALKRSQSTAAFYQVRYGEIKQTVMTLKDEITRQHQSLSYRDNESRFATVRSQLYELIRDRVWPSWNPESEPNGIHFEKIINDFLQAYPDAGKPDTIRRRLNELADERICKPPPLEWKKPGYYLLRHLSISPIAQEVI